MRKGKYLDLLTSIDVLNTLYGGISEPKVRYTQDTEGRSVRVRVPGIDKETIQVDIHNNQLTIQYYIPVVANGITVNMPQVIYNRSVPYYIDLPKIRTLGEGNELVVKLPYNKLANGYHRSIKMDEE